MPDFGPTGPPVTVNTALNPNRRNLQSTAAFNLGG